MNFLSVLPNLKAAAISLIGLAATPAWAVDARFVNASANDAGELCIQAMTSPNAFRTSLENRGLRARDIQCNGRRVSQFVSSVLRGEENPVRLTNSSRSLEAELCIAAATSSDQFSRIRAEHFSETQWKLHGLQCNRMPLQRFAEKYGNQSFTL